MKKIMALVLAGASLVSLSGCFGGGNSTALQQALEERNSGNVQEDEKTTKDKNSAKGDVSKAHLEAEKIDTIQLDSSLYEGASSFYYEEDDMYGIITADGKNISDAEFTYCDYLDNDYYNVSTKTLPENDDPANMNITGVANSKGKIIVPEQYCSVDYLNERYFKVFTVDEITENEDEAILYATSKMFSVSPDEDDILYKGKWEIYDVENKALVPGLTGTSNDNVYAYGNIIEVKDTCYTPDGKALPEYTQVLENGCYIIQDEDYNCTVYDTDSNKLFDYSMDEMDIDYSCDNSPEFMIASNETAGATTEYIVDMDGKKVSAEIESITDVYFDKYIVTYNDSNYGITKLDGTEVVPCKYSSIAFDTVFGLEMFILKDGAEITFVDANGTTIATSPNGDDYYLTHNVIEKNTDDLDYCFNVKTEAYDIENANPAYLNWCAKVEKETDDDTYRGIVDTLTGKQIIDSKYNDFFVAGNYIYARHTTSSGIYSYDIYEITLEY